MNVSRIQEILRERIGLNPDSLGIAALQTPIAERMRVLGLSDPDEFARRIETDEEEFNSLVDGVVVVESWFYRGGKVFAWLVKHIAERGGAMPFRALSIPCCTGEEPYSLKMSLLDAGVPRTAYAILGVDVSAKSIDSARAGIYREFSFRQAPLNLKTRYFIADGRAWRIADEVKKNVEFRRGNLVDPDFLRDEPPFDLILCRNLMIYLSADGRRQALANFERLLSPDGLLGMGHAEPLREAAFEAIEPHDLFLYRRKRSAVVEERPKPNPPPPPSRPIPRTEPMPIRVDASSSPRVVEQVNPLVEVNRRADLGDIVGALEIGRALEKTDAANPEVHHIMGVLHLANRDNAAAMNSFHKALYLKPDHRESLVHLMHLCRETGDAKQENLYRLRLERLNAGGTP